MPYGETLFQIGLYISVFALIAIVIGTVVLILTKKRLNTALLKEYGERADKKIRREKCRE